jgi:hypothetical protein
MRRWIFALGVALCMAGAPSLGHEGKRTDPCGCHHQWGVRHCHPHKKTPRCEAPVRSKVTKEGKDPAHPKSAQPQTAIWL